MDNEPPRPDVLAYNDPDPAAGPEWVSAPPSKASRFKKPLVIAGVAVLILILGGAGVFFALMRPSAKEEIARLDQPVDQLSEPATSSDTLPPPEQEAPDSKTQPTEKNSPPARTRPSPPAAYRRAAAAGTYQTVRDTSVHESPTASSRVVASIPRRFKVNVVGSSGNWLEVRSASGKPPGFIRRSDALPLPTRG
jgi:cytoskeletal protein RodZ